MFAKPRTSINRVSIGNLLYWFDYLSYAGKPVMVVNGAYRGLRAVLESVDVDNFCVSIRIDQVLGCVMCGVIPMTHTVPFLCMQGPSRDRVVDRVAYEDISKLA